MSDYKLDPVTKDPWLSNLILVVTECKAVTGETFADFIMPLVKDFPQTHELKKRLEKL